MEAFDLLVGVCALGAEAQMGSNSHWNDAGKVAETEDLSGWGSRNNLKVMRQFYLAFPKGATPFDLSKRCDAVASFEMAAS